LEVEQAQLVKCGRLSQVLLKDLQKLLFSGREILILEISSRALVVLAKSCWILS
jgi:hypothetical protein